MLLRRAGLTASAGLSCFQLPSSYCNTSPYHLDVICCVSLSEVLKVAIELMLMCIQTSEKWKDSLVETAENVFINVCSTLGLG